MKLLIVILTLLISGYCQYVDEEEEEPEVTSIKDVVNELIEKVRTAIPEPISIKNDSLELPANDYLTGDLDVSDFKLTGLKGFNISLKYVLLIPTSFVLSFDYIDLNLKYVSDLQLLNQPILSIFGEGHALMALTNLTITGKLQLQLSPLNVTINSMGIGLDSAKFLFAGLLNDDDFTNSVNQYLNNNFANLFNQYSNEIASVLENVVNGVISGIINGNSTAAGLIYENDLYSYDYEADYDTDNNARAVKEVFQGMIDWIDEMLN